MLKLDQDISTNVITIYCQYTTMLYLMQSLLIIHWASDLGLLDCAKATTSNCRRNQLRQMGSSGSQETRPGLDFPLKMEMDSKYQPNFQKFVCSNICRRWHIFFLIHLLSHKNVFVVSLACLLLIRVCVNLDRFREKACLVQLRLIKTGLLVKCVASVLCSTLTFSPLWAFEGMIHSSFDQFIRNWVSHIGLLYIAGKLTLLHFHMMPKAMHCTSGWDMSLAGRK